MVIQVTPQEYFTEPDQQQPSQPIQYIVQPRTDNTILYVALIIALVIAFMAFLAYLSRKS